MQDNIIRQAEQIVNAYTAKDNPMEMVQNLVMRCQPKHENWQFATTQTYALPGRWIYIVLLYREVGEASDGRMEVRMKAEMVVSEECEGGKLSYLLKARFDE